MAFAQLTSRESLRDIKACLRASVRASFITWGSKLSGVIPIPSIEQRLDLRPDHRAHSR